MARVNRELLNDVITQFLTYLGELVNVQFPQVFGVLYLGQQIFFLCFQSVECSILCCKDTAIRENSKIKTQNPCELHKNFIYLQGKTRSWSLNPMLYIDLPDANTVRPLSFYLAMEEYVARHVDAEDCFFMWQVNPSVIFGRNQLIENEVNLDFCRKHGIQVFRRKSGGGCVYADRSNVMFSYVTKEEQVGFTFHRYVSMIVLMLRRMGVDASATGRNDIMIGDRKVSGNAFYKMCGRSIVHGTMLYDTDMVNMVGSITPTDGKLLSKGVTSVRQRIALLKDYTHQTLDEFMDFVRKTLCTDSMVLIADDIREIERLEQEYLSDDFIFGKNPHYMIVKRRRIEGVGDLEAHLEMKNGMIKHVNLTGDYFLLGNLDDDLLSRLQNLPLTHEALYRALPDRIDDVVMNLMKEDFIDLLIN